MEWIRASQLSDKGVTLFNVIEPNDVIQGTVADCWLIAGIAALAEFPEYLKTTLFPDCEDLNENGV